MTTGKTCVLCGKDCSARPRVKDKNGRYACQDCLNKRQARRTRDPLPSESAPARPPAPKAPAVAARPAAVNPVMADLLDAVPDAAQLNCPSCGARMAGPTAVLCTRCGFNREAGKSLRTRVLKAPKEKRSLSPSAGIGLSAHPILYTFLAGSAFTALLCAMAAVSESAILPALIIAAIWGFVSWCAMIYAAFKDGDSGWATAGLCQFIPVIGGLFGLAFSLYYCIFGSDRTHWKINYWLSQFAVGFVFFTAVTSGILGLDWEFADPESTQAYLDTRSYADLSDQERLDTVLVLVADEILMEIEDSGARLSKAEQTALYEGAEPADYPSYIMARAEERWRAMSPEERQFRWNETFWGYPDFTEDQDSPPEPAPAQAPTDPPTDAADDEPAADPDDEGP